MSDQPPAPPEVQFPLDTYELLILRAGENVGRIQPDEARRLQGEHVRFLFELQAAGKLLAAGAVATRAAGLPTGIGFFALGSIDEVKRLIADDPSVKAGLDAADVVTFMCPRGALSFPQANPAPQP